MSVELVTKAAVSVTEMARMVGLSRARFYQLVKKATFPSADHDLATGRPCYLEEKQRLILEARRRNCGVDGKPIATQVPLLIEEEDGQLVLRGHVMRGSDHWQGFSANADVLAVFSGPNCPISASWYTGIESASTWNLRIGGIVSR